MLGSELSQEILTGLSPETVAKIQDNVLALIGEITLPEDIDAFVFEELVKEQVPDVQNMSSLEEVSETQAHKDVETTDIEQTEQKVAPILENLEVQPQEVSEEDFLQACAKEIVVDLMFAENKVFHGIILDLFPLNKQKEISDFLSIRGIKIQNQMQKSPIIAKMSVSVKQAFLISLKQAMENV